MKLVVLEVMKIIMIKIIINKIKEIWNEKDIFEEIAELEQSTKIDTLNRTEIVRSALSKEWYKILSIDYGWKYWVIFKVYKDWIKNTFTLREAEIILNIELNYLTNNQ